MPLSLTPIIDAAENKLFSGDLCAALDLLLARAELSPIPEHPPIDFDYEAGFAHAERAADLPPELVARMVVALGMIALMRVESGENPAWFAEEAATLMPYVEAEALEAVLGGAERMDRFLATVQALRNVGN